jgi:hypothetical protein
MKSSAWVAIALYDFGKTEHIVEHLARVCGKLMIVGKLGIVLEIMKSSLLI